MFIAGFALLILILPLSIEPTEVPPDSVPLCHVEPIGRCVELNGDGTYTAFFGYSASQDMTLPIGHRNRFLPAPADRGQGTEFSGYVVDHITVTAPIGSTVTWRLDGRSATLNDESKECNPNAVGPTSVGAGVAKQGLVFALGLVGLGVAALGCALLVKLKIW